MYRKTTKSCPGPVPLFFFRSVKMSRWHNVWVAKCLGDTMSWWQNVLPAKFSGCENVSPSKCQNVGVKSGSSAKCLVPKCRRTLRTTLHLDNQKDVLGSLLQCSDVLYYPRPSLGQVPGQTWRCTVLPIFNCFAKPQWGHAGRQIRVNVRTGS